MMGRERRVGCSGRRPSLVLGLAAVVLQCLEWVDAELRPGHRRLCQRLRRWTAFYTLAVLGALYWLETHVATELRARRAPARATATSQSPDHLIKPGARRGRLLLELHRRPRHNRLGDPLPDLLLGAAAILPLAAHYLTASVLTLVVPIGILALVSLWYVLIWRRDTDDNSSASPRRRGCAMLR